MVPGWIADRLLEDSCPGGSDPLRCVREDPDLKLPPHPDLLEGIGALQDDFQKVSLSSSLKFSKLPAATPVHSLSRFDKAAALDDAIGRLAPNLNHSYKVSDTKISSVEAALRRTLRPISILLSATDAIKADLDVDNPSRLDHLHILDNVRAGLGSLTHLRRSGFLDQCAWDSEFKKSLLQAPPTAATLFADKFPEVYKEQASVTEVAFRTLQHVSNISFRRQSNASQRPYKRQHVRPQPSRSGPSLQYQRSANSSRGRDAPKPRGGRGETLRDKGKSVWYASPSLDPSQLSHLKSQAILGCKAFLPILSSDSAGDRQMNDELALAYISNSAIFPVGLSRFRDLAPKLSGGADTLYVENVPKLVECVSTALQKHGQYQDSGQPSLVSTHGLNLSITLNHGLQLDAGEEEEALGECGSFREGGDTPSSASKGLSYDFWDRHFEGKSEISWKDFKEAFLIDYGDKILRQYSEDKKKLFINLIYKDIFDLKKIITRTLYKQVCANNVNADPHCFYNRVEEYAIAYLSLREVIDMDSTLRITTIQTLGKFSFPAIISGLTDMLHDEDPNIRAVAAIALAKAGKQRKDTVDKLVGIIEDEDRLVRESVCLSLGYLKSLRAVSYIVDRWRNDPISTVRQAAELALSKLNIEEAQKCMRVTKVLSEEMSTLKPSSD